jgi:hypothetical protein
MDPWYNMSAIEQTIGRGIRTCSHKKLPFDKRNVQIFLHASVLASAGFETADLAMYRFSEIKAVKIGTISRALKESSVDCILNMKQNEFTVENIDTEVDLQLSTGGSIRYQIGDKPYTSACDYMKNCNYTCSPDKQKQDVNSGQNVKLGTFNESFILMNVENIIKAIKQAFREKHYYKKKDLIQFINRVKAYSLLQIHFALTQMIHDNSEFLVDLYGKYGYLLNIGDYYFFQPVELNDPSISIFEKSTPIPFKRDKIILSLKSEDVKKGQLSVAEAAQTPSESSEGVGSKESATELHVENIIASIGYTHALSINISLSKKERNDIADAQDPVLKIIPGSIAMTSRDRKWYIYCYEMFQVMKGVLSAEELSWYVFVHIMDHLTFDEINALVLHLHALNQIATRMKASAEKGQLAVSSKVKNVAIKIQKMRESVYEKSLEYASYIIKYFQAFVTRDKDNVLYLFVDNRENVRDISKKIQMYYKKGDKAFTPWMQFQQEELTSTEYNQLKSAFQKSNLADFVGFMQSIKDGDIVFKIKEGGNRGSVCATSPTMKRTLQDILQFKLTNVNVPSNTTQITYCILQEIVLRHYSSVRLNDKTWILNAVEAIYSI